MADGRRRRLFRVLLYGPLVVVALFVAGLAVRELTAPLDRREDPFGPRAMYGFNAFGKSEYLEEGRVAPDPDRPLRPGEARGASCAWIERAYGVDRYPFASCLAESFADGEIVVSHGVWTSEPFALEPAAGELRVGAFGGSVVEGYLDGGGADGVGRRDSWPRRLEARLRAEHGSERVVRVLNYGRAGMASSTALWRLANEAGHHDLDVVLLYLGENDVARCSLFSGFTEMQLSEYLHDGRGRHLEVLHPWFVERREAWQRIRERKRARATEHLRETVGDDAPSRLDERDVLEGAYQSAVRDAIEAFARDPEAGLRRLDPERIRASLFAELPASLLEEHVLIRNLRAMIETSLSRGALPVLVRSPLDVSCHPAPPVSCGSYPLEPEDLAAYQVHALGPRYAALARDYAIPYLDLQDELVAEADPCRMFVDPVHLSTDGLEHVAELLATLLREHATRAFPPPPTRP